MLYGEQEKAGTRPAYLPFASALTTLTRLVLRGSLLLLLATLVLTALLLLTTLLVLTRFALLALLLLFVLLVAILVLAHMESFRFPTRNNNSRRGAAFQEDPRFHKIAFDAARMTISGRRATGHQKPVQKPAAAVAYYRSNNLQLTQSKNRADAAT